MSKISNSAKILFLITSNYPFGTGETFIENEIKYLSDGFDKVIIISHDDGSRTRRPVPNNIEVVPCRYTLDGFEKLMALIVLFSPIFWSELRVIREVYKSSISFGILKTMVISLFNALRLKKMYQEVTKQYASSNAILYSYWCNDSALALALLKRENSSLKCISRIHGWDVFFEPSKYRYLPFRSFISDYLSFIHSCFCRKTVKFFDF